MLFKGTRRRSAREISQAVEGLGGYLNAFTAGREHLFLCQGPPRAFCRVFEVLTDMVLNSRFDPDDLGKERE